MKAQAATLGRTDRLLFAVAAGTLALLPAWDAVFALEPWQRGISSLLPLCLVTMLLAACVWSACSIRPGIPRILLRSWVVCCLGWLWGETALFLLQHLRSSVEVLSGQHYFLVRNVLLGTAAAFGIAALYAGLKRGVQWVLGTAARTMGLLAALPFVYLLGHVMADKSPPASDPAGPIAAATTIVLVMDELDGDQLRQHSAMLPAFKQLAASALTATSAFPPANYTSESLPGMLTGADYEFTSYSRDEVFVRPATTGGWRRLSAEPSIVGDAVARGERVDLIGWHLPYCRLYRSARTCYDDAHLRAPGQSVGLLEWLRGHSQLLTRWDQIRLERLLPDLDAYAQAFFAAPVNHRLRRIGEVLEMQSDRLRQVLRSGRSELVFAHLACPHLPSVERNRVDSMPVAEAYMSNLVACDRLLGEVLDHVGRLPEGKRWSLVVTSDHWFRLADWHASGRPLVIPQSRRPIPFYVLTGRGSPQTAEAPFNTRSLRGLVALLAGPDVDSAAVRAWLEKQPDGPTRLRTF